jgi:hypothetical protein
VPAPPPPPLAAVAPPPPAPPAASPAAPAAPRAAATPESEDRLETLKRWVGYMPEVRLGKAIYRWVKSQPPAGELPPPDPAIQTR